MIDKGEQLTDLQRAMIEHDDDMARLDRNNDAAQPTGVGEPHNAAWQEWFKQVGQHATGYVVNATATLVIAERQAALARCPADKATDSVAPVRALPSWTECEAACDDGTATPLQKFIYDYEPANAEAWRRDLLQVVTNRCATHPSADVSERARRATSNAVNVLSEIYPEFKD